MGLMARAVLIVSVAALLVGGTESTAQETNVIIGLIGDSTVAAQSGWGPAFAGGLSDQARVLNYAKNGATLQSLSKTLDALAERKPDYALIQFGHNDQKRYDTDAYSARLKFYVERIQAVGGKPVIVSSVVRRSFDRDGRIVSNLVKSEKYDYKANLTAYAKAAQAVAEEGGLPFIDLYTISKAHHNTIGRAESMTYNFKEGDKTHFNKKGALVIAGLVLKELERVVPELSVYIKTDDASPAKTRKEEHVPAVETTSDQKAFEQASERPWRNVFTDTCTGNWGPQWFLDGDVGTVSTGPDGMTLTAGPEFKNDAHHMVLWTKLEFEGDLKIEYDYTRLDNENRCVNILYIQATGSGEAPYAEDITAWNVLRTVPAMKTYFNNMNLYHISYAAFGNDGKSQTSYIRGRRYMPHKTGLKGSDLAPDYFYDNLFATGVPHRITVIKKERALFMRVQNPEQVTFCHMTNPDLPAVNAGRIGLRHMYTRSARYRNIRISVPAAP